MSLYTFSPEQFAQVNDVSLCYQTIGDKNGAPLLLVMGLGVQMIGWPDQFCQQLAEAGFYVIRFDNRDVGRSTQFEDQPLPSRTKIISGLFFGRNFPQFYTLADMAADAIGLLDHLAIEQAHVLGASMGGMISQIMAIDFPDRLLSLTSIMSTTNERDLPKSTAKATTLLLRPTAQNEEAYLENMLSVNRFLNGDRYHFEEERITQVAKLSWARSQSSDGKARQLGAVANTPGRRAALRTVTMPALVIHGDADPLVRYQHGIDTAEALPNARLVMIPGMGHALPMAVWSTIIDAVVLLSYQTERPANAPAISAVN